MFAGKMSRLTTQDYVQITQHLVQLNYQELIILGVRLGLSYARLRRMGLNSLLNDMVHSWLRMDDDVLSVAGEPSWETLRAALEACGHSGIAFSIKEKCKALVIYI